MGTAPSYSFPFLERDYGSSTGLLLCRCAPSVPETQPGCREVPKPSSRTSRALAIYWSHKQDHACSQLLIPALAPCLTHLCLEFPVLKKKMVLSQAWKHTLAFSALGRQRQEDQAFKPSLGYATNLRPVRVTQHPI